MQEVNQSEIELETPITNLTSNVNHNDPVLESPSEETESDSGKLEELKSKVFGSGNCSMSLISDPKSPTFKKVAKNAVKPIT